MKTKGIIVTKELLEVEGTIVGSTAEGCVLLWELQGQEYVELCEGTIITREEDNSGCPEEAFFPYRPYDLRLTLNDASICLISKYNAQEFNSRKEKDNEVTSFFEEFEKPYGIKSNVLGYLVNNDGNNIGYVEEHYVDCGSDDYMYTALYI